MTDDFRRGRHRRPRSAHRPRAPRGVVGVVLLALGGLVAALVVAPGAGAAVGVPVTYDDFSYASTVKTPSEDKPQSKLWYADGAWWALMVSPTDARVHIFELRADHSWRDTGTQVDPRLNSTGDALWDALTGTLTVASRESSTNLEVNRFTYSSAGRSWTRTAGFPVMVNTGGGSESATIDKDSTGRLWVTYTRASKVWVAHSDQNGQNWTAGFNPAVPDVSIKSDDVSALISFQGQIGLMWSDQASGAFRFARHRDGDPDTSWVVEDALSGADLADDHINLKGLVDDPQGRLFAAIKTSQDTYGPGATLVGVLVRTPRADGTGSWSLAPAGTVADDHTRPIIMVDRTNQQLYFFATAPVSGGDIYYKKTPLSNIAFAPGRGEKFVDSAAVVNNASGAKEPVTATTGMVILAVAEGKKRYVHAEMQLAGGSPPPVDGEAPSVPSGLVASPVAGGADLTWGAASDNVAVTGYRVRRDGVVVGTSTSTSYRDQGLLAGSSHSWTVQAYDAAGNSSAESGSASATVPDDPPPSGGVSLVAVTTGSNASAASLTIARPAAQAGNVLLASVDYRGQAAVTAPAGWALVRSDSNGTAMRKATWVHVAAGSDPASWTWTFGAKPAAVGEILAFAGVSTSDPVASSAGQVNASSTAVTAPSVTAQTGDAVVGLFGIAKAGTIAPPSGLTEVAEVTSPTGVTYPMTSEAAEVLAATGGGTGPLVATSSVSGAGVGHSVVLRAASTGGPVDGEAPSVPSGLVASPVAGGADLTWGAASDNVAVTGYRVRRDGVVVGTSTSTSYRDQGLLAGSSHSWTVQAYDAAGNSSAESGSASATVPDDPPPSGGVSLVAVTTGSNASAASLTIARPAAQAGNVLLASVDYRGQAAVTAPAGWALVRSDSNGTAMRKATWVHVAAGSDPASWTWTFGAKPAAVGEILAFAGVSTSDPVASSAGQVNASSTAVTAPSVTAQTGDAVVGLFGIARSVTVTPPSGSTEAAEVTSPSGVTYPMTGEAAERLATTAGSTGPLVATSSLSGPSIGHSVVLRTQP